jgi:hypothetical protein
VKGIFILVSLLFLGVYDSVSWSLAFDFRLRLVRALHCGD